MGKYPIGHPEIICYDFKEFSEYFGIVKGTILPPKDIYLPLLPVKIHNRLTFVLRRSRAENTSNSCSCDSEDRAITCCWTTLEIEKALLLNYKLLKIHEVSFYRHFTVRPPNEIRWYIYKLCQHVSRVKAAIIRCTAGH
jgi:hypothetical protein